MGVGMKMLDLLESKAANAFADLLFVLREHPVRLSEEQQKAMIKEEIKGQIHDYGTSIRHGWEVLKERLPKRSMELSRGAILEADFSQQFKEGLSAWQVLGMKRELVDELYREAVRLYTEHRF
jgi:hypothetical protein